MNFKRLISLTLFLALPSAVAHASPKVAIPTADGLQKISVLSEEEAVHVFEKMKNLKRIPFYYVNDGCYARAQRMSYRMSLMGVRTGKLFIVGKLNPLPGLKWKFHVAPFILVGTQDQYEVRIIDPSLFDKPVSVDDWVQASHPKTYKLLYRSRGAYLPDDEYRPNISIGERIDTGRTLRQYR